MSRNTNFQKKATSIPDEGNEEDDWEGSEVSGGDLESNDATTTMESDDDDVFSDDAEDSDGDEYVKTDDKEEENLNDPNSVKNSKRFDPFDYRKSKGMNDAHIAKETVRTLTFLAPGIGDDITTVAIDYPPYIKPDIISHKDAIEETKQTNQIHVFFKIGGKVHEYNCVRNSWFRSGFRRTTSFKKMNAYWGRHCTPGMYRSLQKGQKVNHFPGTWCIGNKASLGRILGVMHRKFGEAYSIHADTYIMPHDRRKIRGIWAAEPRSLWIIKPSNSSCGRGIRVINGHNNAKLNKGTIVQKYLSRPYLINNRKFDLRLYVCVTSFDPLRAYLYDDGLARFATSDYSRNPKHLKNRFMHLTNYSVNKKNTEFVKNDGADNCGVGSKWTLKALRRWFREHQVDDCKVMRDIQDVLVKTLIGAESNVASLINRYQMRRDNCFEVFGFDVFLDEDLKPWVIEVNVAPSLSSSSPLDKKCKNNLLCDVYNLVGFHVGDPKKERKRMEKEEQKRLFGGGSQPRKRNVFTLSEASLSSLSKDDQDMIHEMESEFKRKNNFQRIYPSFAPEVNDYYAQFFEAQRYNNTLCNVWIAACAKGRRPMLTKPANKKNNKQKRSSSVGNSSSSSSSSSRRRNTNQSSSSSAVKSVRSSLESATRLQQKIDKLNSNREDLKYSSRSNSTESARTSDFRPSSSSVEENDSEIEVKNDELNSDNSVFNRSKLRNNYISSYNTHKQQPNPPMSKNSDKMKEPPMPIDFRHQGIPSNNKHQLMNSSDVVDMASIKQKKFNSRIGGGGILSQVVNNINTEAKAAAAANHNSNSNRMAVNHAKPVAAGSASKAIYQVRELQANPSAYKSASLQSNLNRNKVTISSIKNQQPNSISTTAYNDNNNIKNIILSKQRNDRISPRQLNAMEQKRQAMVVKQQLQQQQQQGHFPQPPSYFTARPHTIGISSREKRITVNRVYQQNGTHMKGSSGIKFLMMHNNDNANKIGGRVALTLNGRRTSIDGASTTVRKF